MDDQFLASFNVFERFFEGQLGQFQLIGSIAGSLIVLCGLGFVAISLHYLINGDRVTLKVIKHHQKTRSVDEDDDAENAREQRANPKVRLEFRLQDGPNVGAEVMASGAGSMIEHEVGELVEGFYFPGSMDVLSRAQTFNGVKFGSIFAGLGLGFIALVNFMANQ